LSWSAFVFGSIGIDDGRRKLHRLEDDRLVIVAERVARARVLEPDRRCDVARPYFLDLLALVRVHLQQTADALASILRGIVHVGSGLEHARVDAEERQLSDEWVGRDLERQRRERRFIGGRALVERLVVMREMSLDRLDVDWRRQEVDHRIEQRLDALVLERRATENRHERHGERRLANRAMDFRLGELSMDYFSSSSSCVTAASIRPWRASSHSSFISPEPRRP
jgi:hypothetical protein